MVYAESVSFSEKSIDTSLDGAYDVAIEDIDNDGINDVVACGRYGSGQVVWYKTSSDYSSFTKYVVDDYNGCVRVLAYDFDGDSDIEIVASDYANDHIYLYENDGTPATGTWTRHTVTSSVDPGYKMDMDDYDKDGDMDIVANSPYGSNIIWCENTGSLSFTTHTVSGASGVRGVCSGDIDGDGWVDIVGGLGGGTDDVIWYENDGTPASGSWTGHTIDSSTVSSPSSVFVVDIDGDSDNDVVVGGLNDGVLVWYENVNGVGSSWTEHSISTYFNEIFSIDSDDLDNDSDNDIVVATVTDDTLAWFENSDGSGTSWSIHILTTSLNHNVDCHIAQLRNNGGNDIFGCGYVSDTILWFESNITLSHSTPVSSSDIGFSSVNDKGNNTFDSYTNKTFIWEQVSDTQFYNFVAANDSGFSDVWLNLSDVNDANYGVDYYEFTNASGDWVSFNYTVYPGWKYYRVRASRYV